jgi:acid phosphatase (class A)
MKWMGRKVSAAIVSLLIVAGAWRWHDDHATRFLPDDTTAFVATVEAPPTAESPVTRGELDLLLAIQRSRTQEQVAAARADRKTEVRRFLGALGLEPDRAELPRVEKLASRVEDDVRIYVRAAKHRFRRLRPYEVEPRLEPCIDDVRGDLSYPSGHAAFAWAMSGLLAELAPEHAFALEARARQYACQRVICGVHYPSDLAAGREAAEWLLTALRATPQYREEAAAAAQELRDVLGARPAAH